MLYWVKFWGLLNECARNYSVLEEVTLHHGGVIDSDFWRSVERILRDRKSVHLLVDKWLKRTPCSKPVGLSIVASQAKQDKFTGELAICGASYRLPA